MPDLADLFPFKTVLSLARKLDQNLAGHDPWPGVGRSQPVGNQFECGKLPMVIIISVDYRGIKKNKENWCKNDDFGFSKFFEAKFKKKPK